MHRVFQNFIDLLSGAEDPASFSEAISVAAAALDLSCFAYLALPRKQNDKPRLSQRRSCRATAGHQCADPQRYAGEFPPPLLSTKQRR
jgi:hypothetical protein